MTTVEEMAMRHNIPLAELESLIIEERAEERQKVLEEVRREVENNTLISLYCVLELTVRQITRSIKLREWYLAHKRFKGHFVWM